MRRTVALLATALLTAALPVTTTTAKSPRGKEVARAAWLAQWKRLAKPLPLDEGHVAAVDEVLLGGGTDSRLLAAGDLDGDGWYDLVDERTTITYDATTDTFNESVKLEARRGRDGKSLWTITPPAASAVFPLFMPTGTAGKPGLVVVSYDWTEGWAPEGLAYAGAGTMVVTSYDGAGKQVWTTTSADGVSTDGPTSSTGAWTNVAGVFNAVTGGGYDLLIESGPHGYASDPTYAVVTYSEGVQLSLIDGATGRQTPLGAPAMAPEGYVFADSVGDLDGDKRDDAVVVSAPAGTPSLSAVKSSDGTPLWTYKSTAEGWWWADELPDVTGDGLSDVYVFRDEQDGMYITVLDGKTGAVRWTKPGGILEVVDDRKGQVKLVVGDEARTSSGYDIRMTGYTGSGARLWSSTVRVKSSGFGQVLWAVGGDVNYDGIDEVSWAVSSYAGNGQQVRTHGTVDGRTGKVRRDPFDDGYSTSVWLDGAGADSYVRTAKNGVVDVAAYDGNSGRRLWTFGLRSKGFPVSSFGTYADHDYCGDLVVNLQGSTATSVVVSGKTGRPIWGLDRTGVAAAKVTHPSLVGAKRFYSARC